MNLEADRSNYLKLIQKADHFFEIEQYADALACYQQAYDLKSTFKLNIALVKTLQALKKDTQALAIAVQYEDVYLTSGDDWAQIYLTLLITNHELIQAEKLLDYLKTVGLKQRFKQIIAQESQQLLQTKPNEIQKRIKQSFDLINGDNQKNAMIIADLKQLPLVAYLEALKLILSNPFIHSLYRSELLSFIAPLKVHQTLELAWFGQVKSVDLSQLPLTHQTATFDSVFATLSELLSKDPILQKSAIQTLNLQFILLYPFADETVADPKTWAVDLAEFNQFIETKQEIQTLAWQKRLSEAINQLIN